MTIEEAITLIRTYQNVGLTPRMSDTLEAARFARICCDLAHGLTPAEWDTLYHAMGWSRPSATTPIWTLLCQRIDRRPRLKIAAPQPLDACRDTFPESRQALRTARRRALSA